MTTSENNFYLTLPSNASMKICPENKPQNFKVHLSAPIQLVGKWEVALMEIQYPNNWYNIREDYKFEVFLRSDRKLPRPIRLITNGLSTVDLDQIANQQDEDWENNNHQATFEFLLPRGNYRSIEALLRILNEQVNLYYRYKIRKFAEAFEDITSPIVFELNQFSKFVTLSTQFTEATIKPLNSTFLFDILGLTAQQTQSNINRAFQLPIYGTRSAALEENYPSLFVYTDIVKHQYVGDSLANLLRAIPIKFKEDKVASISFLRPYYVPVGTCYINSIEIDIRNDAGDAILFQSGKVIVVLHFRKCGLSM